MKRVVEISLKEKEGLVLEVKDYGSGIAEDILPHIFDPFYTTKDFRNGTGLGLSTAKSIIEKDFGGSIAAKSDLHGTVLTALFSGERIGRSLK
jgi:two-component system NtrC family sensor kinase